MNEEDAVWDMSDEELELAFREAKADEGSPVTEIEEDIGQDDVVEEEVELDTEEVEEDDLEQPLEDSDDDLETDDDVDEDESEDSETEETDPDEEVDDDEEQAEDEAEDTGKEAQEAQTYKFKANGREYEFSEKEMKEQFPKVFGQAMDYTKKTQQLKPWRKTIDAIEQADLNHDDINLMIDVLKGDKDAVAQVLKRTGVDALDLDTETSNYVPNDYGRDETTLEIKDVVDRISSDPEFDRTQRVLSKEWDESSFNELTKDPRNIELLHADVKSGVYDKVSSIAEKLKVFDGGTKTDLDYYKQAAGQYFQQEGETQRRAQAQEQSRLDSEAKAARQAELDKAKQAEAKRKSVKTQAKRRKAAAPVRANAGTKKTVDYLDDSEESFEQWYKDNVTDKM